MKDLIQILLFCFITAISGYAQEKVFFATLNEVCIYAEANSISFQNNKQQSVLAKYRTQAAKFGMFNLKGQGSFALTNNTKLNTSFIPAEVFGGPIGTFRPITMGQKYVSHFTFEPQIDLINPNAMAQIKVSKTNEQLTLVNNLLDKKAVFENISSVYHNILSYQWQIDVTTKSLANADTLTVILQNKQTEGLVRDQDVNIAIANQLSVKDKLQQLEIQLKQQYNYLKVLCDIEPLTDIVITEQKNPVSKAQFPIKANNDLLQRQAEWQTKNQEAILRADKRWMYPTLTLFSSFSWQESNNKNFFGTNNWFDANYIGLKLSMPLLPEASKIASIKYDRVNLEIARNNYNHSKLQNQINNSQLELNLQKAIESFQLATEIESLHKDSYQKNKNIYQEGIISTTDLINSFNDWLNSSLNTVVQLAISMHAKSIITINNTIK